MSLVRKILLIIVLFNGRLNLKQVLNGGDLELKVQIIFLDQHILMNLKFDKVIDGKNLALKLLVRQGFGVWSILE